MSVAPVDSRRRAVRRHVSVWGQAFSQAVGRETQFRAQALSSIGVGVLQLALSLIPVVLVFGFTPDVDGWSSGEAVALVGVYQIVVSLLATFIAPNLSRMTRYVAGGDLDQVLMRPVSSQLYVTARWMAPAELAGVVSGFVVLVVGLVVADTSVTWAGIVMAPAWLLIGLILLTCFWSNLAYLAFWYQAADPIASLVADLFAAGRYPVGFFPRGVQILLVVVVPIGVATTVPVRALSGLVDPLWLTVGLAGCLAVLVLTRLHWRIAVRRYASASS